MDWFFTYYTSMGKPKDFAHYKDEALEIYLTIVYACTAVIFPCFVFK